jgi:hypothetical protein
LDSTVVDKFLQWAPDFTQPIGDCVAVSLHCFADLCPSSGSALCDEVIQSAQHFATIYGHFDLLVAIVDYTSFGEKRNKYLNPMKKSGLRHSFKVMLLHS